MIKRLLPLLILVVPFAASGDESTCFGTTKNGRLENSVKLPGGGKNFTSYSATAELLGRTYVHSTTAKVLLEAYKALEAQAPGKVFKYAETGYAEGGRFKPI